MQDGYRFITTQFRSANESTFALEYVRKKIPRYFTRQLEWKVILIKRLMLLSMYDLLAMRNVSFREYGGWPMGLEKGEEESGIPPLLPVVAV